MNGMDYNELYEFLRKEKYSEQLQNLSKDFIIQFSNYMADMRKKFSSISVTAEFSDDLLKDKKQYENAMAIFKELMLRRKKKILNLVFIAAETGVMKKDFADMLTFEKDLFEKLIRSVDDADNSLSEEMNGNPLESSNRMILVKEDIEQFVDMAGEVVGPFKSGSLVNLDSEVAGILVTGERAMFVEE
jgi:DNA replication initiation complex subunit (GINS family)